MTTPEREQRLAEIKAMFRQRGVTTADIEWLLSEIERLEKERDDWRDGSYVEAREGDRARHDVLTLENEIERLKQGGNMTPEQYQEMQEIKKDMDAIQGLLEKLVGLVTEHGKVIDHLRDQIDVERKWRDEKSET